MGGRRSWKPVTATAVVFALATLPSAAGASEAATFDFGDAPDGASARYAGKPSVRGTFPSRAASGGPRHGSAGPRIGMRWTAEGDSRQVDRDADEGATLSPRSCGTSTLTLPLDASRVADGAPVYVNAWFDWNQDGDWADGASGGCGPEWGVQNVRVEPAALGAQKAGVVTLRFRAGTVPRQFWWRVQVHTGAPAPPAAGRLAMPTDGGEVDDYRWESLGWELVGGKVKKSDPEPPKFDDGEPVLLLFPPDGSVAHGGRAPCMYSLVGGAFELGSWRITRMRHLVKGEPDADGVVVSRRQIATKIWALEVQSTTEHRRVPPLQAIDVGFEVRAVVEGRRRVFGPLWCTVYVAHGNHVRPPFVSAPVRTPAPARPPLADLRATARIDTAFLDRNGNGRVSGTLVLTNLGPAPSVIALVVASSSRVETAHEAEMTFRTCFPSADASICTRFDLARGVEVAVPWAAPVRGAGPLSMTFHVQAFDPNDPRPGNNTVTVQTELRPQP